MKEKIKLVWRIVRDNPRLVVLAAFVVSAIVALVRLPDGIGMSVSITGDEVTVDQFMPTILVVLMFGAFMAAFTLPNRKAPLVSMQTLCAVVLMIFFLIFLSNNLAAL